MRIKSLQIKNYRVFKNQTIHFDDYTVLVGSNGAGKSTVLSALNIIFREKDHSSTDTTSLDYQDFYNGCIDEPIEIIATFIDLSDKAVKDLAHYVRQGQLIVAIVARYDKSSGKADVKQYGERMGMEDLAPFFLAQNEGKKVSELKEIYGEIRKVHSELPPGGTNSAMSDALVSYEASRPELCVPLRSSDNFYGARKGKLDPYIQWVYVPAVKDAKNEQVEGKNSALGRLLARTVRAKTNFDEQLIKVRLDAAKAYDELLGKNQDALTDISTSLLDRLKEWSHPNARLRLVWAQESDKSVRVDAPFAKAIAGEGEFEGDVVRLGHGLQRSFILAILHELAMTNDEDIPTLLLGVEEPELYQHPPQARHLANVLLKISSGNSQVMVTTHNPAFAPGQRFENVRMFRRNDQGGVSQSSATLKQVSDEVSRITGHAPVLPQGIRAVIHQAMLWSLSEMFFSSKIVFVEGAEDVAFLTYYLQATNRVDALRAKGVSIIACAGKSGIVQAAAIAKCLSIPFFIMWDSDGHVVESHRRTKHEKDNLAILNIFSSGEPVAFPENDIFSDSYVCWAEEIMSRVRIDLGEDWAAINERACNACGFAPNLKKNSLYISEVIIEMFEAGKKIPSLESLALRVLKFSGINGE